MRCTTLFARQGDRATIAARRQQDTPIQQAAGLTVRPRGEYGRHSLGLLLSTKCAERRRQKASRHPCGSTAMQPMITTVENDDAAAGM